MDKQRSRDRLTLGKYANLRFLGGKRFVRVYGAYDVREDREVALRFLCTCEPNDLEDYIRQYQESKRRGEKLSLPDNIRARVNEKDRQLEIELSLLRELHVQTPIVPELYAFEENLLPGVPCMVVELVTYPKVVDLMALRREESPVIPEVYALTITRWMLEVLGYLHEKGRHLFDMQLQNYCVRLPENVVPFPVRWDDIDLRVLDWNGTLTITESQEKNALEYPRGIDVWKSIFFLFQMLVGKELDLPSGGFSVEELEELGAASWAQISPWTRTLLTRVLNVAPKEFDHDVSEALTWVDQRLAAWEAWAEGRVSQYWHSFLDAPGANIIVVNENLPWFEDTPKRDRRFALKELVEYVLKKKRLEDVLSVSIEAPNSSLSLAELRYKIIFLSLHLNKAHLPDTTEYVEPLVQLLGDLQNNKWKDLVSSTHSLILRLPVVAPYLNTISYEANARVQWQECPLLQKVARAPWSLWGLSLDKMVDLQRCLKELTEELDPKIWQSQSAVNQEDQPGWKELHEAIELYRRRVVAALLRRNFLIGLADDSEVHQVADPWQALQELYELAKQGSDVLGEARSSYDDLISKARRESLGNLADEFTRILEQCEGWLHHPLHVQKAQELVGVLLESRKYHEAVNFVWEVYYWLPASIDRRILRGKVLPYAYVEELVEWLQEIPSTAKLRDVDGLLDSVLSDEHAAEYLLERLRSLESLSIQISARPDVFLDFIKRIGEATSDTPAWKETWSVWEKHYVRALVRYLRFVDSKPETCKRIGALVELRPLMRPTGKKICARINELDKMLSQLKEETWKEEHVQGQVEGGVPFASTSRNAVPPLAQGKQDRGAPPLGSVDDATISEQTSLLSTKPQKLRRADARRRQIEWLLKTITELERELNDLGWELGYVQRVKLEAMDMLLSTSEVVLSARDEMMQLGEEFSRKITDEFEKTTRKVQSQISETLRETSERYKGWESLNSQFNKNIEHLGRVFNHLQQTAAGLQQMRDTFAARSPERPSEVVSHVANQGKVFRRMLVGVLALGVALVFLLYFLFHQTSKNTRGIATIQSFLQVSPPEDISTMVASSEEGGDGADFSGGETPGELVPTISSVDLSGSATSTGWAAASTATPGTPYVSSPTQVPTLLLSPSPSHTNTTTSTTTPTPTFSPTATPSVTFTASLTATPSTTSAASPMPTTPPLPTLQVLGVQLGQEAVMVGEPITLGYRIRNDGGLGSGTVELDIPDGVVPEPSDISTVGPCSSGGTPFFDDQGNMRVPLSVSSEGEECVVYITVKAERPGTYTVDNHSWTVDLPPLTPRLEVQSPFWGGEITQVQIAVQNPTDIAIEGEIGFTVGENLPYEGWEFENATWTCSFEDERDYNPLWENDGLKVTVELAPAAQCALRVELRVPNVDEEKIGSLQPFFHASGSSEAEPSWGDVQSLALRSLIEPWPLSAAVVDSSSSWQVLQPRDEDVIRVIGCTDGASMCEPVRLFAFKTNVPDAANVIRVTPSDPSMIEVREDGIYLNPYLPGKYQFTFQLEGGPSSSLMLDVLPPQLDGRVHPQKEDSQPAATVADDYATRYYARFTNEALNSEADCTLPRYTEEDTECVTTGRWSVYAVRYNVEDEALRLQYTAYNRGSQPGDDVLVADMPVTVVYRTNAGVSGELGIEGGETVPIREGVARLNGRTKENSTFVVRLVLNSNLDQDTGSMLAEGLLTVERPDGGVDWVRVQPVEQPLDTANYVVRVWDCENRFAVRDNAGSKLFSLSVGQVVYRDAPGENIINKGRVYVWVRIDNLSLPQMEAMADGGESEQPPSVGDEITLVGTEAEDEALLCYDTACFPGTWTEEDDGVIQTVDLAGVRSGQNEEGASWGHLLGIVSTPEGEEYGFIELVGYYNNCG